jgi:hypothetical protein
MYTTHGHRTAKRQARSGYILLLRKETTEALGAGFDPVISPSNLIELSRAVGCVVVFLNTCIVLFPELPGGEGKQGVEAFPFVPRKLPSKVVPPAL